MKPKDEDDQTVATGKHALETDGPGCLARAGECATAWDMFHKSERAKYEDAYKAMAPDARKASIDALMKSSVKPTFDNYYPRCRGKI